MLKSRIAVMKFAVALMVLGTGVACGQNYPEKTIRMFAPGVGGVGDLSARLIAPGLSSRLGQPVVIENRGPGIIATETAMKATPDGYTLLVQGTAFWINPLLQKLSYNSLTDFLPISLLNTYPLIVVVHPSLPVKSIKELIALAKARPGELNYAMSGIGGPTHLAAELLKSMTGVNIVRVNYNSVGSTIIAIASGETQVGFHFPGGAITALQVSGKLKFLAVTTAQPSALVPGLPTVAASGLPGYEMGNTTGIFAPAKTPAAIITRLNQEIVRFLSQPDVKEKFFNSGVEAASSTPEALTAMMKGEITTLGKVIKEAGIRIE